jgi:hypothetical protein
MINAVNGSDTIETSTYDERKVKEHSVDDSHVNEDSILNTRKNYKSTSENNNKPLLNNAPSSVSEYIFGNITKKDVVSIVAITSIGFGICYYFHKMSKAK